MLRKTLMAMAMLALLAPIASAQSVDELVAKYIEAKGGMAKLKGIQSLRITGKMIAPQGMEIPVVMSQKRPKSFRMEFSFQGMTGVQAYDGSKGWAVMPFTGKKDPEQMTADDAKEIDEQADIDGPLVDYKTKGNTVELAGKEQVEGADAYKLKVTLKNGNTRYMYLDAESYLEVKVESKRMARGTEVEGESYISNYKEVEGMMMPFAVENGMKGNPMRQKIVVDKIEVNPTLSDSLFAMPAGAVRDTTKAAMTAAGATAADSTKAAAAAAAPDSAKSAAATTPDKPGAKKPAAKKKK